MYTLNKWTDELLPNSVAPATTPAQHTLVYVERGEVVINGTRLVGEGSLYLEDTMTAESGASGATLWRWGIRSDSDPSSGLLSGQGVTSILRMRRTIKMFEMFPTTRWLLRLDRVLNFQGTTGLHSHPGSGIRCLLNGTLRTESEKNENTYSNRRGDVWYEEGAYPLVSTVDADDKATFLRGMVLPPEYFGHADTATWISGFSAKYDGSTVLQDRIVTLR